jgi:hypothetical protein
VRGDKGIPDDLAPGTVVRLLVADRSVEADARRAVEAAGAIVARVVVDAKPVSVVATADDATELTPLDALEAWAQAQDLPEDLARSVLSLGRAIISGEER